MWAIEQLRKMKHNICQAIVSLPDENAVETPEIFPPWVVGVDYTTADRVRFDGNLYRCKQAHRSQSDWSPVLAVSLWEEVAKHGSGDTPSNPILYNNNMVLERGKYYCQNDVVYVCIRDTVIAVYNNLSDLVGLYVEIYTI